MFYLGHHEPIKAPLPLRPVRMSYIMESYCYNFLIDFGLMVHYSTVDYNAM